MPGLHTLTAFFFFRFGSFNFDTPQEKNGNFDGATFSLVSSRSSVGWAGALMGWVCNHQGGVHYTPQGEGESWAAGVGRDWGTNADVVGQELVHIEGEEKMGLANVGDSYGNELDVGIAGADAGDMEDGAIDPLLAPVWYHNS